MLEFENIKPKSTIQIMPFKPSFEAKRGLFLSQTPKQMFTQKLASMRLFAIRMPMPAYLMAALGVLLSIKLYKSYRSYIDGTDIYDRHSNPVLSYEQFRDKKGYQWDPLDQKFYPEN